MTSSRTRKATSTLKCALLFFRMLVAHLPFVVDAHTQYRNYDDLNEFFWSTQCLTHYYATPKYNTTVRDVESGERTQGLLIVNTSPGLRTCSVL